MDHLCDTIAGKGKLAGVFAVGTLFYNFADATRKLVTVDAVQNHLGHGKLPRHAFTARFKIQRLGQTLPFLAASGHRLGFQPAAAIVYLCFFGAVEQEIKPFTRHGLERAAFLLGQLLYGSSGQNRAADRQKHCDCDA